jgi:hypothetical protein
MVYDVVEEDSRERVICESYFAKYKNLLFINMYRSPLLPERYQRVKRFLWFRYVAYDVLYGTPAQILYWLKINRFTDYIRTIRFKYPAWYSSKKENKRYFYFDFKKACILNRHFREIHYDYKVKVPFYYGEKQVFFHTGNMWYKDV